MSESKSLTLSSAVLYGGLIAGILDAADGVVAYYLAQGLNPIQVLQFIASGFYGAAAFQKGLFGAFVGLIAHFFIAFVVAAIYVGASRIVSALGNRPVLWGTAYGAAVFLAMNFIVLPQTAVVKSAFSLPLFLNGIIGHSLFVGLPIALAARRTRTEWKLVSETA
jgi:uncharacterized membrane protein YagU involved in acid resistance